MIARFDNYLSHTRHEADVHYQQASICNIIRTVYKSRKIFLKFGIYELKCLTRKF